MLPKVQKVKEISLYLGKLALGWYIQGGPYLSNPATGDNSIDLSAKTGFSVAATESLSVYGELSGVFADDSLSLIHI